MQKFKTFLTVIGAVTILVLAANSAVYAATGGKFILGHTNKTRKVSTLKRTTSGPALKLKTSSSSPPLIVNGTGKVANLNADRLDGLDSSAFATASYVAALAARGPIARGFVNTGNGGTNPSLATGSSGVSAVSWSTTTFGYVLTVTGQAYSFNRYVTLITPTCENLPPTTSSVGVNLLVRFGSGSACSGGGGFAYLIYKIS